MPLNIAPVYTPEYTHRISLLSLSIAPSLSMPHYLTISLSKLSVEMITEQQRLLFPLTPLLSPISS